MADPKEKKNEEDKVAAAYENISKKLESLRNGEEVEDEEDSESGKSEESEIEEGLEEWKGPKPMKNPEVPEENDGDLKIRRVKLKNLQHEEEEDSDSEDDEEDDEEEEPEDEAVGMKKEVEDDTEEEIEDKQSLSEDKQSLSEDKPRKNWEPKENDPLDEEDSNDEASLERNNPDEGGAEDKKEEFESSEDDEPVGEDEVEADIPVRKDPQPDTLDDLTEDRPQRRVEEEDEYFIPNLKGSGQRTSNMEYNTPIERERSGESYQKSSMDTNDPNNFFSQHNQPQAPKRASKFHLLILVIIGIVVIGFTVYILKGGFGELSLSTQSSPSPSPVESPSSTPTPTPEPDRAQYKLRVLNGSGKTGLAASVSAKLKDLGYQTEKTGNATNSAFAQTIVRVKSSLESFIPQIVKDLSPDFDAAGNSSLKDSDTVDIEVILGAK